MSGSLRVRGQAVLVDGRLRRADLLVEDGRVAALGEQLPPADRDLEVAVVSPGYVDLHVHALDGSGTIGRADLPGLAAAQARRGVTGFLATTIASPVDELVALLGTEQPAGCLGLHLEGPWLATAGAQPLTALATPSLADLERLLDAGRPAMITLAPELPGALEVIARGHAAGVVMAMGHSAAGYDQALAAVRAGARHVTHCFNAMSPLHQREPGLAGAALDLPDLTVEVIADGVHVHPAVVRLLWRTVGAQRLCLVSDAVDLAASGQDATRLEDGTLAGSRIGLDAAVRNVVSWGIPLADALLMASVAPARAIGRDHSLRLGGPADLVLLDDDLRVVTTLVDGEPV